jgi:hypothetical protein
MRSDAITREPSCVLTGQCIQFFPLSLPFFPFLSPPPSLHIFPEPSHFGRLRDRDPHELASGATSSVCPRCRCGADGPAPAGPSFRFAKCILEP